MHGVTSRAHAPVHDVALVDEVERRDELAHERSRLALAQVSLRRLFDVRVQVAAARVLENEAVQRGRGRLQIQEIALSRKVAAVDG